MSFFAKLVSSKIITTKTNISDLHPKLSGVMSTASTVGLMVAIGGSATLAAIVIGWSYRKLTQSANK